MTGTIVNAIGILLGSLIGLLFRSKMTESLNSAIIKVEGLGILIIGLGGTFTAMFSVDAQTGRISSNGSMLLLVSLVCGCFIGELLKIDDHLNNVCQRIEARSGLSDFSKGFVTASLIFVIGAMGIVGSLNDGLSGDSTLLYTKAMLDFTTSVVLSASLGIGVIFSAIPVFVYQGAISLFAHILAPYISDGLLSLIGIVGYAIVAVIGFNFLCDSKVKTANLLPALLFPIGYYVIFQICN